MSGPHHHGDHDADVSQMFTQETWDARYAESDRIWSGRPNPRLVEQVSAVTPGRALDIGAGEGADAVWLASQGWEVTAVDISEVALSRAAAHAAEAGVADRVTTLHQDVLGDDPLPGDADLVSAQFLHPPVERFDAIMQHLGEAVRPGGLLLIVGHHPEDVTSGVRSGHGHPELLFTPDRVVAALPAEAWDVRVAEAQPRTVDGPDGPVTVTDTVVLAARR
ncbi:MAG TPA: methyltransferase domain-containing protein [Marmoricola sp.]|nr:methyltransferase domain-containing protein [Marmoricola sp.]